MLTDADGFELVFESGEVAGFDCDADCCGVVSGYYRAVPCRPGVGCGGGPEGAPVWIPTDYVCAPDGSPPGGRTVIGFDRACWIVDTSNVWRLCAPSPNPPPTLFCIPPGSRILAPGTAVACLDDCTAAECLNSLQRWVTLHPCDTVNGWPPGQPLPVVRADGFVGGCIVGRTASGQCFRASCSDVFAARQEDLPPGTVIFDDGIDFAFETCCQCQCNGGQTVLFGCDEQYPPGQGNPPNPRPPTCCCPPFGILNDGATLRYRKRRVTRGFIPPGFRIVQTETWEGSFTVDSSQPTGFRGSGTYVNRIDYVPGACPPFPTCPPSGCFSEDPPAPDFRQVVCPPPVDPPRPCPDQLGLGYSWIGWGNCSAAWSRLTWVNPNPPACPAFGGGTESIVTEGSWSLTGVDNRQCGNGCGGGAALPFGLMGGGFEVGPAGVVRLGEVFVAGGGNGPMGFGIDAGGGGGGGGGCAGCGDGGL